MAIKMCENLRKEFYKKFEKFEKNWKLWDTQEVIDWLKMIDFPKSVLQAPLQARRHF